MALALALALSPGVREQQLCVSGFFEYREEIQSREFLWDGKTILLLLGEKAGMRESVTHYLNATESGGEHARITRKEIARYETAI